MKITEINGLNDTVIEREATADEIEQLTKHQNETLAAKQAEDIALLEKAQAKAALLERLGITADEATLLLS
jgi:hypothetical protein